MAVSDMNLPIGTIADVFIFYSFRSYKRPDFIIQLTYERAYK